MRGVRADRDNDASEVWRSRLQFISRQTLLHELVYRESWNQHISKGRAVGYGDRGSWLIQAHGTYRRLE